MSCSAQYQIFVKASSMPPSHRPIVGRYLCLLLTAAARGAGSACILWRARTSASAALRRCRTSGVWMTSHICYSLR